MAKKSAPKADPESRIIDAVFRLSLAQGWRHVSMTELAEEAGMTLAELRELLPAKTAFLELFMARIDKQVEQAFANQETSEPPRERVFDVLMTRFEQLNPHRDGLAAVLRDSLCDPLALPRHLIRFRSAMKRMADTAQISTSGPFGAMRLKGIMIVYASVFRVWLNDETADLSKTMRALDKALTQAGKIAERLPA